MQAPAGQFAFGAADLPRQAQVRYGVGADQALEAVQVAGEQAGAGGDGARALPFAHQVQRVLDGRHQVGAGAGRGVEEGYAVVRKGERLAEAPAQ